jgi:hypothetical protein
MGTVCKKYGHYTDLFTCLIVGVIMTFEEFSGIEPGRSSMMLPSDPGWETSGWEKDGCSTKVYLTQA